MERKYVKRTQKGYTMQFKLQVVSEVEDSLYSIQLGKLNVTIVFNVEKQL